MSAPYHNKALPEGTLLREWRLEEVLGVGGFGIVYRGKEIHFGESVAIKEYFPGAISDRLDGVTVTPTDSSSEEIYQLGRQKFLEEAKLLWNLSHPERHPNIVSVRSLFEIHGTAYMVMDFESGVSLSQMLRDGKRFDEQGLLSIVRPIAQGLERAHRVGVLHRDIKPANILISPEGRPVLIDFGSARFESSNATNTKVTFYTPPYAAIEQYVKSYPQGPWTDIYALGVVLYQCVADEKPQEVLERMHGEDGHALSDRDWPGFSKTFTRAVDAAMAIRPAERPANLTAWLSMFEAKESAMLEEATRVAAIAPQANVPIPSPLPPPPPPPMAVATKVQTPPVAASTHTLPGAAPAKRSGKFAMIALGSAAIFAILAGAGLVVSNWNKGGTSTPSTTQAASPADGAQSLAAKMDAVIEAAKKASRKDNELSALADAKTKLDGLVTSKADPAQLAGAAADTAKTETDILTRTERRLWRDVDSSPADAPSSPDVIKLQQSKTDLDTKLAAAPSQDAGQILDNLRLSLVSFGAFQEAYTAATPAYIAAKRKNFDTLRTATQSLCDQVTTLAGVEKPWFLASSARKDAYKLRQDNAAQAKTLATRLSELAGTVAGSSDLHQLASAVTEATAAKKTATGLYAASNAAQL